MVIKAEEYQADKAR